MKIYIAKDLARSLFLVGIIPLLLAGACEKNTPVIPMDSNPYYQVMFYNVENLFDLEDDPEKNDQEFTPSGRNEWTKGRYQKKLNDIARVVRSIGGDTLPVCVGLCEIENKKVLEDLLNLTSLQGLDFRILHHDSPDSRGIDVALLYRERFFRLLNSRFYPVWFPFDTATRTREVLYAKGVVAELDTLHLFVNHWPSRSGGEYESRPKRIFVAELIRSKIDSILMHNANAHILITGDLNDEPSDLSVVSGLNALQTYDNPKSEHLYDLTALSGGVANSGTYKYQGAWNLLDHMIISGSLLDTSGLLYSRPSDMTIYAPGFLLEDDPEFLGQRPSRTYWGTFYHGGASDHLPVILKLRYHQN